MKKIIDDKRLIFKCCTLYYKYGINQEYIAEFLKISRPSVARMIKTGHELGIVKIEIINPFDNDFYKMEVELERKFNLKEAIIVNSENINEIAFETFKFLSRTLEDEEYVGVSMGMTLRNIANNIHINDIEQKKCTFIPIVGGIGESRYDIHSNYIAMEFARIFKSKCLQFFAPLLFSDMNIKNKFLQEDSIKNILETFNKISTIIVGIGMPIKKTSTLLNSGYINEKLFDDFVKNGMVGDVAVQFFNKNGDTKPFEAFNKLVAGMNIEQLKNVPRRICIANGIDKAESIIGAIKGNFINILITDFDCANKLLN